MHILGPGIIAQAVLRCHAETAERQTFRVDELVDVISQEFRHVFRVLAKGRDAQPQLAKVCDEIAAQLARIDERLVIGAHGSDDARVDFDGIATANRCEAAALKNSKQHLLRLGTEISEFVDDQRAARGALEDARHHFATPFDAQQLFLAVGVRYRRGRQDFQRLMGAAAQTMHVAREGAPAGTRLAADQYRAVMLGKLLHALTKALHQRTAPDRRQRGRQPLAGCPGLFAGRLQRRLDGAQQLGQRQRLLDEVERAEARRLDGRVDRAVPRHDDHRAAQVVAVRPLPEQRDAVRIRHPDIEQNQVESLRGAGIACLLRVRRAGNTVAFVTEDVLDQISDIGFVVDDEYMRVRHACSLLLSARPGACAIIISRAASSTGSRTLIIAPPAVLFAAWIVPTCSSTSFLTMASPRPVPLGLVVT